MNIDHLMLNVTVESESDRERDGVQAKYFISQSKFKHLLGFFSSIKVFISKGFFLKNISF